jgi:AcrR family transcriptional regulator
MARRPETTRKVGRPARISRELIAEAAHEIGLADLTLKAVAERLGVSVASLYHHIDGRDELFRVAAEYSVTQAKLPADEGQHWAVWLVEWARYNRDAFVAQPELLTQYLDGAISIEAVAQNTEAILSLLVRQGFSVNEARAAYEVVSSCAIGFAVNAIREDRAARGGRPALAEYQRVLAQHDIDDLPLLRELVAELTVNPPPVFEARLVPVLAGIAAGRGEQWRDVARKLRAAGIATGTERTTVNAPRRNGRRRTA